MNHAVLTLQQNPIVYKAESRKQTHIPKLLIGTKTPNLGLFYPVPCAFNELFLVYLCLWISIPKVSACLVK